MANYIEITFGDLSYDKQQALIQEIKNNLLNDWESTVKLRPSEYSNGKTWQEKFMRFESIKEEDWKEDENYDFKYWLEDYAEEEAEKKLVQGFRHLEVEVEL